MEGANKVYYKRCANGECCLLKEESAILDKTPWDSKNITAVLCVSHVLL